MNRKHLFVSTAVAAVLAFSSQAEAGLLGGSAGGGLGGSLSRGPINGAMSGDLNSRFRATPDVGAVENKAAQTAHDAKGAAGSATSEAKSAGPRCGGYGEGCGNAGDNDCGWRHERCELHAFRHGRGEPCRDRGRFCGSRRECGGIGRQHAERQQRRQ